MGCQTESEDYFTSSLERRANQNTLLKKLNSVDVIEGWKEREKEREEEARARKEEEASEHCTNEEVVVANEEVAVDEAKMSTTSSTSSSISVSSSATSSSMAADVQENNIDMQEASSSTSSSSLIDSAVFATPVKDLLPRTLSSSSRYHNSPKPRQQSKIYGLLKIDSLKVYKENILRVSSYLFKIIYFKEAIRYGRLLFRW